MTINAELFTFLSGDPGISALVASRVYPVIVPQEATYPCIRFERNNDGGDKDFDGQGGTIRTDLQVDCLAETLTQAEQIAEAVKALLKNYTGTLTAVTILRASLESEFDTYEPNLAEGKFRVSHAWTLWHHN